MDFVRLFDLLSYQNTRYPQKAALVSKVNGNWQTHSTKKLVLEVDRLSSGLLDLDLKKGDKAIIITHVGRPEWNIIDFALQQIGVIVVPVHATCQDEDLKYIFENSDARLCFVSNQELLQKVLKYAEQAGTPISVYTMDNLEGAKHWASIQKEVTEEKKEQILQLSSSIKENDIATILYTSGTTGQPKGVMLSHKNFVSNIKSIIALVPIDKTKTVLSFLPLSHVFERMVTYTYFAVGASLYYAEGMDKVMDNLKEVRPNFFTSVPRLLEKMYDRIKLEAKSSGRIKRKVINWALQLGEKFEGKRKYSLVYKLKLLVADLLVYRYWRNALGGRVEKIVVGAAALQPKLGRLFSAARVEIREGYGMTETSPVISFNRFEPGGVRFGTVGIALPGVDIKLINQNENGEGEILVKGPNVMLGYFKNPEATKKVIDEDGWFNTGDIGQIANKRFLKITDRKKDIFKTSSGKYIAPIRLERKLQSSPFIEQSMIFGFNQPFVIALIVPDFEQLKIWCDENEIHWTAPQFMAINPKVVDLFEGIINSINDQLAKEERIRKFLLLFQPWNIAQGEMTPTLKLKRPFIAEKFKKEIKQLYYE